MPYIRHRDRMIQESVFEDIDNTLIACRWKPGTTSRPVRNPDVARTFNRDTGVYEYGPITQITTTPEQILPLLEGVPVSLIDYFPEAEGDRARNAKTPLNTLAMDTGQAADPQEVEMGSPLVEQQHTYNLAFYAVSDAVAVALMNDLRDRYNGRIVAPGYIELYDYVTDSDTSVQQMEVEAFRYTRNEDVNLVPSEVHLYFAELVLIDTIDY